MKKKYLLSIIVIIGFTIFLILMRNDINVNEDSYYKNFNNNSKIDTLKLKVVKEAKTISEIFYEKRRITLEANSENLIGEINSLIYCDSLNIILAMDQRNKNIFLFDENGKYIRKIGNYGYGPEEYAVPTNIYLDKNHIVVFSDNIFMTIYDIDGNFREKHLYIKNEKYDYLYTFSRALTYNKNLFVLSLKENPLFDNPFMLLQLKDYQNFYKGYQKGEYCYNKFGRGMLVKNKNKLIFSSLNDGKIYEFNINNEEVTLFSDLKINYDISEVAKINNSMERIDYWIKKYKDNEIDGINEGSLVDDYIFVQRTIRDKNNFWKYSIVDINGNVHRERIDLFNMKSSDQFLKIWANNNEKGSLFFSTEPYFYPYKNGIILKVDNLENNQLTNPILVFMEMKKKLN